MAALRENVASQGRKVYLESLRRSVYMFTEFALCYKISDFSETSYLKENPDILPLIRSGRFKSGYHHWLEQGRNEHRRDDTGRELFLDDFFAHEALLFVYHLSEGRIEVATDCLNRWKYRCSQSFPNIDLLLRPRDFLLLTKEFVDPNSVCLDTPNDFFIVAFYQLILLEFVSDSTNDIDDNYLTLLDLAEFYYKNRNDYWADRVRIWCVLRAAIADRLAGRLDETRARCEAIRQHYWGCPPVGHQLLDVPSLAFQRAVLELAHVAMLEGDLLDVTVHAATLANRIMRFADNELRLHIYKHIAMIRSSLLERRDSNTATITLGQELLELLESIPELRFPPPLRAESKDRVETSSRSYDILFLIGDTSSESMRYRVLALIDCLELQGRRAAAFLEDDFRHIEKIGASAETLVVFRCIYSPYLAEIVSYFRRLKSQVVYDIDDLFFDPTIIKQIAGLDVASEQDRINAIRGIEGYRMALLYCDAASAPTRPLVDEFARLGRPGFLIPNVVGRLEESLAEILLQSPRSNGKTITIGYFSGSWTHQKDVSACEDAIYDVMTRHLNVTLLLIGRVAPTDRWKSLGDRVRVLPYRAHQEMLSLYLTIDISVAPLEAGNRYCDVKSPLKIFEAGLFEVPTIASATPAFLDAIDDGVDGMIARDVGQWTTALERLISDANLRREIGRNARVRTLRQFSSRALGQSLHSAYAPAVKKSGASGSTDADNKLRISWIIPMVSAGSGGMRNILRFAHYLNELGHKVTLYIHDSNSSASEVRSIIVKHFYNFAGSVVSYKGEIHRSDVVFATHWSTVAAALRNRRLSKIAAYFVQDFEPAFSPLGTDYILAEDTYRKGLYHITSGPYCEKLLRQNYNAEADHFRFPLDRSIYWPRKKTSYVKSLIFFARPEMPRRCFELGCMVLTRVKQDMPSLQITAYGSDSVQEDSLPFEARCVGILPSLEDLAQLYSDGTVGLVFSLTNPSLVPYEMMACGLPVIDIRFQDNIMNYGGREDIALLAPPDIDGMADAIIDLLNDESARERRIAMGLAYAATFPNEFESVRRVEKLLYDRIAALPTA